MADCACLLGLDIKADFDYTITGSFIELIDTSSVGPIRTWDSPFAMKIIVEKRRKLVRLFLMVVPVSKPIVIVP